MDRAGAGCSSAVLRGFSGRHLAFAAVEVESTAPNGLHAAWAWEGTCSRALGRPPAVVRRPSACRTPAGAANARGLASPRLRRGLARRLPEPPGRHQAACPCPGTAGTPGTGPGCPRRVREAGSGGDCRLQRRMTTPAGRRARVYSAFSAARRRMCRAAAQECPPRISGVSGHRTRKISCFWRHRRCIAAADGVVAWRDKERDSVSGRLIQDSFQTLHELESDSECGDFEHILLNYHGSRLT